MDREFEPAGFLIGADCYSFDDYQTLQTSIVIQVH
jgi:hypothetical protein